MNKTEDRLKVITANRLLQSKQNQRLTNVFGKYDVNEAVSVRHNLCLKPQVLLFQKTAIDNHKNCNMVLHTLLSKMPSTLKLSPSATISPSGLT